MSHSALDNELLEVVAGGDAEAASLLLARGADVHADWPSGPLTLAVQNGDQQMVGLLLEHGARPGDGLHWASFSRSINPMLPLLLARGADPNTEDHEGITPLFVACGRSGSYRSAKLLLDAGADPNHRCADGDTPLMWAAYQRDWWLELENPLQALLDAGADPNFSNRRGGSVPTTALIWAARAGHWMNVRILLDGGADPNLVDCTGTTALLAAAAEGHTQIVRDLLERGADPRARDSDGATARTLAERHIRELRARLRTSAERAP